MNNVEKHEYLPFIEKTWHELKDFQKSTVSYVYRKLYTEGQNKFLIADEVGLGKTVIAKGIIAKAFENFTPTAKNPTFNVIYICSNQVLARENLKKLNFSKKVTVVDNPLNRLIYLVLKPKKTPGLLKFDSLTPSTSLTISNRSGSQYERAIIYSLLAHFDVFQKRENGLKLLLQGSVTDKNWNEVTNRYFHKRNDDFNSRTFSEFRRALLQEELNSTNLPQLHKFLGSKSGKKLWNAIISLCSHIDKHGIKGIGFINEVIVALRKTLTKVCLNYLGADLIILDEFQRYAEILESDTLDKTSAANELAQAVFALKDTKVLMLSATPFKPYTTIIEKEKGEDHFSEFRRVLRFLMNHNDGMYWSKLEKERRLFFHKISNPIETLDNIGDATKLKKHLQKKYREAIVRTERIKVSDDQNAMLKSTLNAPIEINSLAIKDFVALDRIVQLLRKKGYTRIASPVEYCKSCPYPLSFLDGYQLKKNLEKALEDEDIIRHLKNNQAAWIDLNEIKKYQPLGKGKRKSIIPNPKMQLMIEYIHKHQSWRWLWHPPTICYYDPEKIYPAQSDFSKTLIFSSWRMVPRAISTVISYEAERQAIVSYYESNKAEKPDLYFTSREDNKKRRPTPILTFKKKAGTSLSAAMSLFSVLYPSKYLSELYDPEQNIYEKKSISEIIESLTEKIKNEFCRLNLQRFADEQGTSERWYWAAALLFDKFIYGSETNFEKLLPHLIKSGVSIHSDSYKKDEEVTGENEKLHILDFINSFKSPEQIGLGPIPDDLFKTLALICLSSPSICFLRALKKQLKTEYEAAFISAYSIGISKIHFFNKPESIAIVKSELPEKSQGYWISILNYCLHGNLQAVFDEFIHLLAEASNSLREIQELFADILSLTTAGIKIDDLNTFTKNTTRRIRTNYAVDFGTQNIETDSGAGRSINVRQAFNSPYRPFVLASTSIGQEGLDFHYYCGSVMHWNLPGNAIDIEQREGRINRYKGFIIRKNIAAKYLPTLSISKPKKEIWKEMFKQALKAEGKSRKKCELVPYWHIEPENENKIERIIPLYPLSQDVERYKILMETLTYYRLTFGQPRQEELVSMLIESGLSDEQITTLRNSLMIDLSP